MGGFIGFKASVIGGHASNCQQGIWGYILSPSIAQNRATVIVDKSGKAAYVKVQEIKTARDDKEILDALKKLG